MVKNPFNPSQIHINQAGNPSIPPSTTTSASSHVTLTEKNLKSADKLAPKSPAPSSKPSHVTHQTFETFVDIKPSQKVRFWSPEVLHNKKIRQMVAQGPYQARGTSREVPTNQKVRFDKKIKSASNVRFWVHQRKRSATIGSQTKGKSARRSKPAKSRPDRPEIRRKPHGMEVAGTRHPSWTGRQGSPGPGDGLGTQIGPHQTQMGSPGTFRRF